MTNNNNILHPEHPENPLTKLQTTDWNRERLLQLKKLFPDLFTNEGKLNIDELKKVVAPTSVTETERYEFRWFGKSNAKRTAFAPSKATLRYDPKRSTSNHAANFIIEGENLEVLKILSNSYREQIKCIYIDPPYNTGKDFVYTDNFTENKKNYWEQTGATQNGIKIDTNPDTDGRYHSNWLNMMYSRLLIARQLLRNDGVIFISIDDNEVHHLRKLCDEVFGEENFFADIVVIRSEGGGLAKRVIKGHDNLIAFCKDAQRFQGIYKPRDIRGKIIEKEGIKFWIEEDWLRKEFGKYGTLYYEEIENVRGIDKKNEIDEGLRKDEYRLIKKGDKHIVGRLRNIDEDGSKFYSIIKHLNKNGIDDMANLEIETLFDYPKPVSLVKELILGATLFSNNKNDIILDFFAGSGTTGQAVMELNQEDGGNRRFILVQLPEATQPDSEAYKAGYKKISDITIERNKRVVAKIKSKLELQELKNAQNLFESQELKNAQNLFNLNAENLGFKVFQLVKSNFPRTEWAPDPDKSDEENIATLKKYIAEKEAQLVSAFNRDELLTEVLLKRGFQLHYATKKQEQFKKNEVFLVTDGIKETLICLDVLIDTETVSYFKNNTNSVDSKNSGMAFICLERALDTTKKYNLKHYLGNLFMAF